MVDATEIFHDLCWLLECEMATLEYIKDIKRTPKYELKRHASIIEKSVEKVWAYCRDYGFNVDSKRGRVWSAVTALNERRAPAENSL